MNRALRFSLLGLVLLLASFTPAFAQLPHTHVSPSGDSITIALPIMTAAGDSAFFDISGYAFTAHQLTFTYDTQPSGVTVKLQCSADGSTTSDIGSSTSTTGATIQGSANCKQFRVDVSGLTGSIAIRPVYRGFSNPAATANSQAGAPGAALAGAGTMIFDGSNWERMGAITATSDASTPSTSPAVGNLLYNATASNWDFMRGDTTGLSIQTTNDPCASPSAVKQSVSLAFSSATTTAAVAAVSGKKVYACAFTIAMSSGTTPTIQFKSGTGGTCGTATTTLTGVMALPTTSGSWLTVGAGHTTFTTNAVTQELCYTTAGTTPTGNGWLTYVQQ